MSHRLRVFPSSLPSGAAIVGRGADPSGGAAEVPGGGVEEARAGAG